MLIRAPALRSLRTIAFRPATSQPSRSFSHPQGQLRSSSPPSSSQSRTLPTLACAQWTRFQTPYTYSSVRTFAHSAATSFPSNNALPSTSSDAAARIDEAIEEIQELYGTARDEFEIAAEETEKNTTYAADDRTAAREELDRLLEYYRGIVEGSDRAVAEEVKRRVGQRIRELEQAVIGLEESVTHGD